MLTFLVHACTGRSVLAYWFRITAVLVLGIFLVLAVVVVVVVVGVGVGVRAVRAVLA